MFIDGFKKNVVRRKVALLTCSIKNLFVASVVKVIFKEFLFLQVFEDLVVPEEVLFDPVRLVNLENQYYIGHVILRTLIIYELFILTYCSEWMTLVELETESKKVSGSLGCCFFKGGDSWQLFAH